MGIGIVPMVLQREGNREQVMDLYSRLLKDRIIIVQGEIERGMANIIKSELLFLEAEDSKKDITMYIDSPGGEIATGMGIFDTMQYIKPDVVTVCTGLAASMGSVLLMGGTKGKRYALPHSQIMIHQPSAGTYGKVSDMEATFKQSVRLKEMMNKLYADITGKSEEEVKKDLDRDYWLTAAEAVDYGIIDKVITGTDKMHKQKK